MKNVKFHSVSIDGNLPFEYRSVPFTNGMVTSLLDHEYMASPLCGGDEVLHTVIRFEKGTITRIDIDPTDNVEAAFGRIRGGKECLELASPHLRHIIDNAFMIDAPEDDPSVALRWAIMRLWSKSSDPLPSKCVKEAQAQGGDSHTMIAYGIYRLVSLSTAVMKHRARFNLERADDRVKSARSMKSAAKIPLSRKLSSLQPVRNRWKGSPVGMTKDLYSMKWEHGGTDYGVSFRTSSVKANAITVNLGAIDRKVALDIADSLDIRHRLELLPESILEVLDAGLAMESGINVNGDPDIPFPREMFPGTKFDRWSQGNLELFLSDHVLGLSFYVPNMAKEARTRYPDRRAAAIVALVGAWEESLIMESDEAKYYLDLQYSDLEYWMTQYERLYVGNQDIPSIGKIDKLGTEPSSEHLYRRFFIDEPKKDLGLPSLRGTMSWLDSFTPTD